MSNHQPQGSIILKILIIVAAIVLIAVILVPGEIWENEEQIKEITLADIESLYEAQRYYYNLNQNYSPEMNVLLTAIHNDSTLEVKKQVVDYTIKLRKAIDGFIDQPIINSLIKITQNITNIETDFESNNIYFSQFPEIKTQADDLKFKVIVMKDGVDQINYSMTAKSLDSLLNLRRDLSDYQLQVAARRSHSLTSSIVKMLPEINFTSIADYWTPLDASLTSLMNDVNAIDDLKQRTAVADRVADFQQAISSGFRNLNQNTITAEISNTQEASEQVNSVYEEFLSDFLTTEKYVQYSLTNVDSMLLNLSEENFYTPLENKPYNYQFMDTLGLVVEDPTLLDELKESALSSVEEINKLPFFQSYKTYLDALDSLNVFAMEAKAKYRRNAEVHFKTKDLQALVNDLKATSTLSSYQDIYDFASETPSSNSFSKIKQMSEDAMLGVGLFKQVAETQIFGKLDTVHLDLLAELDSFTELLSTIRRNKITFDEEKQKLEELLSQTKTNTSGDALVQSLAKIEQDLQDLFFFATEGKEESVYGIFSTKVVNHGRMYGRTGEKSWQEEK